MSNLTLDTLKSHGYRFSDFHWNRQTGGFDSIYTKRSVLSNSKPWTGAYGREVHGVIHQAVIHSGNVVETSSWRAIHNIDDGSWWYCANVPAIIS